MRRLQSGAGIIDESDEDVNYSDSNEEGSFFSDEEDLSEI